MIGYRSFRNGDTPRIAEIWRTRSGLRGYVQPMTTTLFERHVLSKSYFDHDGLIVATEDGKPLGFAHAGFGPTDDESEISTELGASILAIVGPHPEEATIAKDLLSHCETYLRGRGAKAMYGGGVRPLNAFYIGLYGGSELPGILDSDLQQKKFFVDAGYKEIDHIVILHRELTGFRALVDRQQMQLRRQTRIETIEDPRPRTWWEACTLGDFPRMQYKLYMRETESLAAVATLIEMEAFSHTWGVRAGGIHDVWVDDGLRRKGMAVSLLGEILRQAGEQGFGLVEAQTMQYNTASQATFHKLGFHQVDTGTVFRKAV